MKIEGKEYNSSYKRHYDCDWMKYVPNKLKEFEEKNKIYFRIRESDAELIANFVKEKYNEYKNIFDDSSDNIKNMFENPPMVFEMFEMNFNSFRVYVMNSNSSESSFDIAVLSKNREVVLLYIICDYDRMHLTYCNNDEKAKKYIEELIFDIKRVLIYVLLHQNKCEKKNESDRTVLQKQIHGAVKENKDTEIKIKNAISFYNKSLEEVAKRKITKECYGVRGHYRHYKNGKIVFIKPYKKGTNRDGELKNKQIYHV